MLRVAHGARPPAGNLEGASFSPDGRFLLFQGHESAEYWDLVARTPIEGIGQFLMGKVQPNSFLPDNQTLLLNDATQVHVYQSGSTLLDRSAPRETKRLEITSNAQSGTSNNEQRMIYPISVPNTIVIQNENKHLTEIWRLGSDIRTLDNSRSRPDYIVDYSTDAKRGLSIPFVDAFKKDLPDQNIVVLWDLEAGKMLTQYLLDAKQGLAKFSPDGQKVLTIGHTARIVETSSGQAICTFNRSDIAWRRGVFSPDSRQILLISQLGTTSTFFEGFAGQIYDLTTCQEIHRFEGLEEAFFRPDGRQFIAIQTIKRSGPYKTDGIIELHILDSQSGRLISTWQLQHVPVIPPIIQLSPDGQTLLFKYREQTQAEVREAISGRLLQTLRLPEGEINSGKPAAFAGEGRFIIIDTEPRGDRPAIVIVYDAVTGNPVRSIPNATLEGADQQSVRYQSDNDFYRTAITLDGQIEQACDAVWRDFTKEERQQFGIADELPTCPKFVVPLKLLPTLDPVEVSSWTPIPTRLIETLPPTSTAFGNLPYSDYLGQLATTAARSALTPAVMVTLLPITPYQTAAPAPITRQVQPITMTITPTALATANGALSWTPIPMTPPSLPTLSTLAPTITAPTATPSVTPTATITVAR